MFHRLIGWLGALLISHASAEPIDVTDTQGRSLSIELLALEGNNAVFTVPGKGTAEYQLPLAKFDEVSQKLITAAAAILAPRIPPIEIEATVGKRRKKLNFYLVRQTVSAKVRFQNPSRELGFPGGKARILFIGRNRKDNTVYSVLRTQDFEVPTIASGRDFEFETKSFSTEYDSDKDGYGNIGGFQYDAYIVGIFGEDDRLLGFKTSDPSIRSAIGEVPELIRKVLAFPSGKKFDKDLQEL